MQECTHHFNDALSWKGQLMNNWSNFIVIKMSSVFPTNRQPPKSFLYKHFYVSKIHILIK